DLHPFPTRRSSDLPCTTSDWGLPAPSYRVDVPESALATHQGLPVLRAMPHELIRFRSVCSAGTAPSETRLCTVNEFLLAGAAEMVAKAASTGSAAPHQRPFGRRRLLMVDTSMQPTGASTSCRDDV